MALDKDFAKDLKETDLRFVSDSTKGIMREKNDNDFEYRDADGSIIKSETVLERIKHLVIPPAWKDVWICPSSSGYLQATGIDEKKENNIFITNYGRKKPKKINSIK